MQYYINSDSLCHHGILGMKWGVRRYQNKDGSLTAAGKKRYDVNIEAASTRLQSAKADEKKARQTYYRSQIPRNLEYLNKASRRTELAKDDLNAEKIKQKLNNETKKSAHRLKLEKQYREKGLTEEDAAIAAYKRVRTEKIVAATLALSMTAAASYVAYKHYDLNADKVIKSDTLLSRVAKDGDQSVHDAFYAVLNDNKSDRTKYIGLYGNTLESRGNDVFQKVIRTKDSLNLASEKSATKILGGIINEDPQYATQLKNELKNARSQMALSTPKQKETVEKAIGALNKGKVNADVYKAVNFYLANHSSGAVQKFYDSMKKKGYDAIIDINDKKLSGYMANKPLIVFNSSKTVVDNVRKVGEEEVRKALSSGQKDIMVKTLLQTGSQKLALATGLGIGAKTASKASTSAKENKIVQQYRDEHPNTKLSDKEIIRNYYK